MGIQKGQILSISQIAAELPVFSKKAKRDLMTKRKFYFFDVGLYRGLRPKGPLDNESELGGPAFETLCLQELMAINHHFDLGYDFFHWRTRKHEEIDLILYGENGFLAFEFKSSAQLWDSDFKTLHLFGEDYPQAKKYIVYGGPAKRVHKNINILSASTFFQQRRRYLKAKPSIFK